jgi:hypothetical protein
MNSFGPSIKSVNKSVDCCCFSDIFSTIKSFL